MTIDDLKREFIKTEPTSGGVAILLQKITWDGPHSPISSWVVALELPVNRTDEEIQVAISEVGKRGKCFRNWGR